MIKAVSRGGDNPFLTPSSDASSRATVSRVAISTSSLFSPQLMHFVVVEGVLLGGGFESASMMTIAPASGLNSDSYEGQSLLQSEVLRGWQRLSQGKHALLHS